MTHEQTLEKLRHMRLSVMADALREQDEHPEIKALSFEERLGLLVDIEYTSRINNRLSRTIKHAQFDQPQASIADINDSSGRQLDKSLILKLASGHYIEQHHNVMIMGATGAGKSYLACALGMEACKQSYHVLYTRLPDLLSDIALARADGSYHKCMKQLKNIIFSSSISGCLSA